MEKLKSINTVSINKCTFIIYSIIIFILLGVFPEVKHIGFNSLKTMLYTITTILATMVLLISKIVEDLISENERNIVKLNIYEILLAIYAVLIIISSLVSEYKFYDILWGGVARGEGLMTILCYIATFVIFEKNFKYSEKFFACMTGAVVLVSAWGIVQTIIPEYINLPFINKSLIMSKYAVGNMGNPNFFSSYLLIFLPVFIVKYIKENDIGYLLATAITFMAFISARTLSGYLTFIIVFIILSSIMYKYMKEKKKALTRITILLITLIISFGTITLINGSCYIDELKGTKYNVKQIGTNKFGSNRGMAWKIALKVMKDYPTFGIGLETFGMKTMCNEDYYYNEYKEGGYYFDKAHCEYLHIGAVTGIPALATYLTFLTFLGINLIKKYNKIIKNKEQDTESILCIMAAISIFSYLFQAGANISITYIAPVFWAMMGIGVNLCAKNKQQNIDK